MEVCRQVQRRGDGERGQTVAEFSVVVVIFMIIALGIVDLSRAVYARNMVANAAREGARYASTHPDDTEGIKRRAMDLVVGLDKSQIKVTVKPTDDGTHVQVDVTCKYYPIAILVSEYVDGGTGAGILLHGRSIMRKEWQ